MPAYAYKAQCNACLAHDTAARLNEIIAPTLIAAGDCDLFVPETVVQKLHRGIHNSQLYVCPNGGHVHQWEYLEDYNRITLDFLLAHRTKRP
jgi:pimeloyl-ACP methyl ester carboxylesterase